MSWFSQYGLVHFVYFDALKEEFQDRDILVFYKRCDIDTLKMSMDNESLNW